MKIIFNSVIPFKGFKAINLFGILFIRKPYKLDEVDINHEAIHTAQMKELGYIFFYIWYIVEYLVRFCLYHRYNPYKMISFEVEAYKNEDNLDYLKTRKHYNWLKYE